MSYRKFDGDGVIEAAGFAFAARLRDGTVVTWGHKDRGGDSSAVESKLKQVEAIYADVPDLAPGCPTVPSVHKDGSMAFWAAVLAELIDEDDVADVASKMSNAGLKQKHIGMLPRDDLKEAGLSVGVVKDLLSKQNTTAAGSSSPNRAGGLLQWPANLCVIPEHTLKLEEEISSGAHSVVRQAIWSRTLGVGNRQLTQLKVAVKQSKAHGGSVLSPDMFRDVAVICGLPHQNIVTLHGVCESTPPRIVYEYMPMDLATLLKTTSQQKLKRHVLVRVLRDIAAGTAHLHAHGVIHRDLKPTNVLVRDDQVKLCDFGSSKDLQHTVQQMSVVGSLDYMAPEMWSKKPVGKAADVWSFGVLLFECVMGFAPVHGSDRADLLAQLKQERCLPKLIELFSMCHQVDAGKRPSMAFVSQELQQLVMQDARDNDRLKDVLRVAEAQDVETYNLVWDKHYAGQEHMVELLAYVKDQSAKLATKHQTGVVQPLQSVSMEALSALANAGGSRLHSELKALIEKYGGKYVGASRKSEHRSVQKVQHECGGDYRKLLDLERCTGLFEDAQEMLACLTQLSARHRLQLVRLKDRLNTPLKSGYRDALMNVCDMQSGFIGEVQLNFGEIAQIKSQTHRFYEMVRVMELPL